MSLIWGTGDMLWIPYQVVQDNRLSLEAKMLYLVIGAKTFMAMKGYTTIPDAVVEEYCGIPREKLHKARVELMDADLVEIAPVEDKPIDQIDTYFYRPLFEYLSPFEDDNFDFEVTDDGVIVHDKNRPRTMVGRRKKK